MLQIRRFSTGLVKTNEQKCLIEDIHNPESCVIGVQNIITETSSSKHLMWSGISELRIEETLGRRCTHVMMRTVYI